MPLTEEHSNRKQGKRPICFLRRRPAHLHEVPGNGDFSCGECRQLLKQTGRHVCAL